jgi:hypothetical protein
VLRVLRRELESVMRRMGTKDVPSITKGFVPAA